MNNLHPDVNKPSSAQEQLTQTIIYKQKLKELLEDTENNTQHLNRQMQRQQTLVAAALNIEETNRQKLQAEKALLNELEEENKNALLELALAKQKSVQTLHAYNEQLNNIKGLHSRLEEDTAAVQNQQETIRRLMENWQNSNFFMQKQQTLSQELETRLQAIRKHLEQAPPEEQEELPPLSFEEVLPQLSELEAPMLPTEPEPKPAAEQQPTDAAAEVKPNEPATTADQAAQPAAENLGRNANHANANFWEAKQHAYLKLNNPEEANEAANLEEPQATEDAEEFEAEDEPKTKRSSWKSYLICIVLALAVALSIRTWVLMPTQVSGSSMQPTLEPDDKVITSPLPYLWGAPQRGDIVVFQAPSEADGVYYVKRIIGLPGEHLQISDGQVYIDNLPLNEDYLDGQITGGFVDTLVPDDSVFVMGDNRQVSHDSRDSDVSFIKISTITGKAIWRIYPFNTFGMIE